jgi:glycosyltransferase involved in cell wall biosynthesis
MKKKIYKKINIFTYDYPYVGNDSHFIEDEINKITKIFKYVKIIPLKKGQKLRNTFKHHNNIEFDQGLSESIFSIKIFIVFFNIFFCKYLWKQLFKIKKPFFFKKIKMTIKERILSEFVILYIKKKKFDIHKEIFYSYWANHTLIAFNILDIRDSFARSLGSDLNGFLPGDNYVPFINIKYKKLKFILTLNYGQQQKLLNEKLIKKHKIIKCYQGMPVQTSGSIINKDKSKITFLSCGSLIHVKNTKQIIEFLSYFSKKERNIEIFYICIGKGNLEDEIFKLKKNVPANLNISFIKSVPNLVNYIKKKNINYFINFSKSEGMSFAVMEALSMSLPVISSNIPGNKEIINNYNGFIIANYNNHSFEVLTNKIITNYFSEKKYLLKRKLSSKLIRTKLNRERNLTKFGKIMLKKFS